ncbi:PucR family transcriptional regulator [Radiobacillus sp. PE A8.2]|uniref:PucR family transcriptional regulator n=1 Tax=Radiobacillus sp. PE A8.2 TaxID=3380349 RepID=UPI00388F71C9
MGITVEDVIKLPVMETSKVKTGKQLLHEKSIEWISVIEVPVENFVRKNEFVLSTGIGCEDDPVLIEEFVKDVIQSGASVLAFATGRYIFDIPDRVLQLAALHEFIIIDIPWEIRFGDIIHSIMREISEDKQEERQLAETVRQELINCVLQNKELLDITDALYNHTKMPVAVTNGQRQVRANQHFDLHLLGVFCGEQKGEIQQIPSSDIPLSEHPIYHHLEEYVVEQQVCFQLPILNNHKAQGYLLFQPKNRDHLTWFVMNVLEHALTAFALYFVKEDAVELTEIRLKDNFVLNLAKNHGEVTGQVISKAELLGYDLMRPYICIVGYIHLKQSTKRNQNDNPVNSSLQSMNYYIQKEITYAGNVLDRRTMTTFDDGKVIIYLEADNHPYMETANQFLDIIERRLSELVTEIILSWGIAIHKDGHFAFYKSFEEAESALDIGMKQHGPGERTSFSDTKINRLLMALSHDEEIAEIVKDTIQPVLDYDNKRQTDLLYTFLVYNKYKGNVSQAARALNLHRQSLLHRLRNIESLTQLSLVDSDDLFLLELSVRLWMLKKMN